MAAVAETYSPRLKDLYEQELRARLKEELELSSVMQVPRLQKITLNMVKRHTKPRPIRDSSRMGGPTMQPGGVIEKPAPINVSNVMIVCPACNRPTRVGVTFKELKGRKVRVRICKRADCGQEIDR